MDSSATGDYTVLVIQIEGSTIPFFPSTWRYHEIPLFDHEMHGKNQITNAKQPPMSLGPSDTYPP